ncbi:hypothetical protein N658DRAFT_94599 [Parathielavia hyrcaniae]|uniref:Uncharacterized protein n=1 Tax=Parathielavia hyrcaniae TaxID=113614 RepID=A0AAN6PZC4_9PEZI|nr:hypothetical protein N658DRAFT_94599 [Parathielavia hyrcaniae]
MSETGHLTGKLCSGCPQQSILFQPCLDPCPITERHRLPGVPGAQYGWPVSGQAIPASPGFQKVAEPIDDGASFKRITPLQFASGRILGSVTSLVGRMRRRSRRRLVRSLPKARTAAWMVLCVHMPTELQSESVRVPIPADTMIRCPGRRVQAERQSRVRSLTTSLLGQPDFHSICCLQSAGTGRRCNETPEIPCPTLIARCPSRWLRKACR